MGFATSKTVSNVRRFKKITEDRLKELKEDKLKREHLQKFKGPLRLTVIEEVIECVILVGLT